MNLKLISYLRTRIFYYLKPVIPRRTQIKLRRKLVSRLFEKYKDVWPIYEPAADIPRGWKGWPEGKQFALVLTHDVEKQKGHDKCRTLMNLEIEKGFRSSFNFVPERYNVSAELRKELLEKGFEVGVHGLKHDGKLYKSRKEFLRRSVRINEYLENWGAVGFRSPAMHHNLEWIHDLKIKYDSSTFDTDPFEPQPDGVGTVFPFWVNKDGTPEGYVEMPYTLPQDFTLFITMKQSDINIWKNKIDWIAQKGGMVLLNTHPDYMSFNQDSNDLEEFPARLYAELLDYLNENYRDKFWHALPREVADYIFNLKQGNEN